MDEAYSDAMETVRQALVKGDQERGNVPLPLRGRRLSPWIPRDPCKHKLSAFVPIQDFLGVKLKITHDCAVRVCSECGMVSGVMW